MNWIEKFFLKKAAKKMGTFLDKILKGNLGWKTVSASAVLVLLVFLRAFGVLDEAAFEKMTTLAEAFGLLGLRDALSKLPK